MRFNSNIILFVLFITLGIAQENQWQLIEDNYADINVIALDPNDKNTIYIENENGPYKTVNGGVSWDTVGVGFNNKPKKIMVDPANGNILWAAGPTPRINDIEDWMGVAKSSDGGLTWAASDSGINYYGDFKIAEHETRQEIIGMNIDWQRNIQYAHNFCCDIFFSTNNGIFWEKIGKGGLDLFVDHEGTLYSAGKDGVKKKSINGEWQEINNGLPGDPYTVLKIAKVRSSKTLYCLPLSDQWDSQLYKSLNDGESWFPLTLIVHRPGSLIISEKDTNTVFISSEMGISQSGDTLFGGVWYSGDSGENWQLLKKGFGNNIRGLSAYAMTYDEEVNVLYSYMEVSYKGNSIKALFRSEFTFLTAIEDSKNVQKDFILSQNYPNPFNNETIINYQLPITDRVMLKIFDISGREITTLVNSEQSSGTHSVVFDADVLSSGVYLYRIATSSGFSQSRKMILLK